MTAGTTPARIGMMAGGIAMFAALLVMQLVSRVTGPELLLTETMPYIAVRELNGSSGWLADFLLDGDGRVRIVVALLVVYILAGAGLGRWVASRQGIPGSFAMQAGAILLFASFTLLYVTASGMVEVYFQEVLIALALAFLVWVFLLNWLITGPNDRMRWGIGGALALIAVGVLTYDMSSWL